MKKKVKGQIILLQFELVLIKALSSLFSLIIAALLEQIYACTTVDRCSSVTNGQSNLEWFVGHDFSQRRLVQWMVIWRIFLGDR